MNVTLIIRLNSPLYDENIFKKNGIDHLDLVFDDGTAPPNVSAFTIFFIYNLIDLLIKSQFSLYNFNYLFTSYLIIIQ
jgi:hypothetical protein